MIQGKQSHFITRGRFCRSNLFYLFSLFFAVILSLTLLTGCGGGGGGGGTPTTTSGGSDTTVPLSPSVSINSGATSTTNTSVTLTLSAMDNVGVTAYYASETSTTPSATASGWTTVTSTTSYSATVNFTLSSGSVGDNSKTVYVWFKDSAGNVSVSASDSITYSPVSSTITLPKTGQTTVYSTDDDGALQKGVTWPSPRFTVGTGAEADCITDNLTGLMWVKSPDSTTRTWANALTYANDLSLCGYTDWRLPNVNELESLINVEQSNTASWLNTQGFINVQADYYWSSTASADGTGYAWYVFMSLAMWTTTIRLATTMPCLYVLDSRLFDYLVICRAVRSFLLTAKTGWGLGLAF